MNYPIFSQRIYYFHNQKKHVLSKIFLKANAPCLKKYMKNAMHKQGEAFSWILRTLCGYSQKKKYLRANLLMQNS